MAAERILVVDDDHAVRRMLERTLVGEGYAVALAADGGAALAEAERRAPDLVVLDVAMPGLDGLAVARRLRARGVAAPILMLTARDAIADRVDGLDAGADDYLVKPFAADELLARLRALARRPGPPASRLAVADIVLDPETRTATRRGRELDLTPREAELLALLMRSPRRVLTREWLLEEIWGGAGTLNVVDRYVGYLRRKLGAPSPIHTVRGVGFRLEG